MAFRESIKNKNFILGLVIGFILTLGRGYVPVIDDILGPLVRFWSNFFPDNLLLGFFHLYISGIIIFIIYWVIFSRNNIFAALKLASFGIIFSYLMYVLLVIVAISQFNFSF